MHPASYTLFVEPVLTLKETGVAVAAVEVLHTDHTGVGDALCGASKWLYFQRRKCFFRAYFIRVSLEFIIIVLIIVFFIVIKTRIFGFVLILPVIVVLILERLHCDRLLGAVWTRLLRTHSDVRSPAAFVVDADCLTGAVSVSSELHRDILHAYSHLSRSRSVGLG